jgi:hypothetical protein
MVKKKNIITQGSVCPKSAYNFASSLSSSSLLNHGGQLSFCFLLPTYEQLTGLYLCSNSLRASTDLVVTYYPSTYLPIGPILAGWVNQGET